MKSLDWCEMSWKKRLFIFVTILLCFFYVPFTRLWAEKKATLVLQNQSKGALKHTGQTGKGSKASEFKTVNVCDF